MKAKRLVELNVEIVNALLGYECDLNELIPRIDNHFEELQQPSTLLTQNEVEEFFEILEDNDYEIHVNEKCFDWTTISVEKYVKGLKTKFQQMQQEIEELRAEADITFHTLFNQKEGTVTISEERFNELDKNDIELYKTNQLLDEMKSIYGSYGGTNHVNKLNDYNRCKGCVLITKHYMIRDLLKSIGNE